MSNEQEFEAWLQRERPAGCVADMERGWKAGRAALAATPAPAEPVEQHFEQHLQTYAEKHPALLVRQLAGALLEARNKLAATPAPAPQPLTDEQIEGGRSKLFSVGNPYCPITEKAMRTAVRWAERCHGIGQGAATPAPAEPVAWRTPDGKLMRHDPSDAEEYHNLPRSTPLYAAPQAATPAPAPAQAQQTAEYQGVRCICVPTGYRAGPGRAHHCGHCRAHIAWGRQGKKASK